MFWKHAPDQRMLRTLDWMNDECEATLKAADRLRGEVTYEAIMSPISVQMSRRNRKRVWNWPISVLITDKWLIVATKKRVGRRASVHKLERAHYASPDPREARVRLHFTFASLEEAKFLKDVLPGVDTSRAEQ